MVIGLSEVQFGLKFQVVVAMVIVMNSVIGGLS